MSWDGMIVRAPDGASLQEWPAGLELSPLGTTDEIGDALIQTFPDWEHTQGKCRTRGADFSLTLTFDAEPSKPVLTSIWVRVGGFPGPEALALLKRACEALNARFIDVQASEFADFDVLTCESMDAYSAWVGRAMATYKRNDDRTADGQALES